MQRLYLGDVGLGFRIGRHAAVALHIPFDDRAQAHCRDLVATSVHLGRPIEIGEASAKFSGFKGRVWFDDIVVATDYIGPIQSP